MSETLEQQKSFEVTASVSMLRYDLEQFGQVLPETKARVCDEELSFLVEGVDRAARTPFVLKREGDEIVYFDRGEWKPYAATLITGLKVAQHEAEQDFRRSFLVDRATEDLANGYKLGSLKPGEKHSWHSPYPQEIEDQYGVEFVKSLGFVPDRKMGFLYQATCQEDGSVMLESQTIDNSDDEAFAAAMEVAKLEPQADLDDLMLTYDGSLSNKLGGDFYAGRLDADAKEDAWKIIKRESELIEYHLNKLEEIAANASSMTAYELENVTKEQIYGTWAAFKKRIDGTAWRPVNDYAVSAVGNSTAPPSSAWSIEQEVRFAFKDFVKKGVVMGGCGGTIKIGSKKDVMDSSIEDIFSTIFGEETEVSAYEKKVGKISRGKCVVDACPTRPGEVKVGGCGVCLERCQKLFDEGKDPTKMGAAIKAAGRGTIEEEVSFMPVPEEQPESKKKPV